MATEDAEEARSARCAVAYLGASRASDILAGVGVWSRATGSAEAASRQAAAASGAFAFAAFAASVASAADGEEADGAAPAAPATVVAPWCKSVVWLRGGFC